jgi:hypothetical protein
MRWSSVIAGAALAAVALPPAARAERRAGHIVRLEHAVRVPASPPQFFSLTASATMGTYGRAPAVGSEVLIVDADGVQGVAVVTSVEPRDGGCRADLWEVRFRARWELEPPAVLYTAVGVQGLALGPRARLIDTRRVRPPTGDPTHAVWVALDRDGDDLADAVVTAYACEEPEEAKSGPADASDGARTCVDVHLNDDARGSGWRLAARDSFVVCR